MKKTKTITLFNDGNIKIIFIVHANGKIKYRNQFIFLERDRQYNKSNVEQIKEWKVNYHKDNRESIQIKKRIYYQNNKDSICTKQKIYYQNNKESVKARTKQWRIDNAHKSHIIQAKCRSKRRGWGKPIIINNWFEDSHLHHLHEYNDNQICMYIPLELHQSIWHSNKDALTMSTINKLVWRWFDAQPENFIDCDEPCDAYRDDMLTEYTEHILTVEPIPNIKGTTQLFEDEE